MIMAAAHKVGERVKVRVLAIKQDEKDKAEEYGGPHHEAQRGGAGHTHRQPHQLTAVTGQMRGACMRWSVMTINST